MQQQKTKALQTLVLF